MILYFVRGDHDSNKLSWVLILSNSKQLFISLKIYSFYSILL